MIYFSGVGTLTRDPELRHVGKDQTVCKFGLATNRKFKGEEKASFFDCEIWGKSAEVLAEYKKKGERLLVNGFLDQDSWETDGQKRSKIILKVNDIQFLPDGKSGGKKETTAKPSKVTPKQDDDSDGLPF